MVGSTYQANLQIVQTKNAFVIRHEIMHGVRIIPVDGTPHVAKNVRMLFGDSRGRWDGDTLVVDTTNYTDRTPFRGPPATTRQDIFTGRDLHVTERFTRVDADSILYRFTVDDPGDVRQAVVGRDGDAEDGRPALRVRVPRRQLRPGEHPERRTRRRTISRRPDRAMKITPRRRRCRRRRSFHGGADSRAEQDRPRSRSSPAARIELWLSAGDFEVKPAAGQSHPRHDHRRDGQHEGRIDRERHAGQGGAARLAEQQFRRRHRSAEGRRPDDPDVAPATSTWAASRAARTSRTRPETSGSTPEPAADYASVDASVNVGDLSPGPFGDAKGSFLVEERQLDRQREVHAARHAARRRSEVAIGRRRFQSLQAGSCAISLSCAGGRPFGRNVVRRDPPLEFPAPHLRERACRRTVPTARRPPCCSAPAP